MKEFYSVPKVDFVKFHKEDVITTSNTTPSFDKDGNIIAFGNKGIHTTLLQPPQPPKNEQPTVNEDCGIDALAE